MRIPPIEFLTRTRLCPVAQTQIARRLFWRLRSRWVDSRSLSGFGRRKRKSAPAWTVFADFAVPMAELWAKKAVKNGPLRSICSRRSKVRQAPDTTRVAALALGRRPAFGGLGRNDLRPVQPKSRSEPAKVSAIDSRTLLLFSHRVLASECERRLRPPQAGRRPRARSARRPSPPIRNTVNAT